MSHLPKYPLLFTIVLVVSMVVALLCLIIMEATTITIIMGICLVVSMLAALATLSYATRISGDSHELRENNESRIKILNETLINTETALATSNEKLLSQQSELESLKIENKSFRNLTIILRKEVIDYKKRIQEGRLLIKELRQRAELSDKFKAAFVANINHELRTPINVILGYMSYISSPEISEEKRQKYMTLISTNTRRFLDTVNDIFYYSQLIVGDIKIVITTFNIVNLLNTIAYRAQQWIKELNREIVVNVSCESNIMISGYELGFNKILHNLVHNAVKFTNSGHIDISCVLIADKVIITVEDTGIGFDTTKKNVIFGGFNQGDATLARKYEGSGLGLSICRLLSRLMNGNVDCDSHEGVGSKFWVEIPIMKPCNNELDIYERVDEILSRANLGERILVVTPFDEDFDFIKAFFDPYNIPFVRSSVSDEALMIMEKYKDISMVFLDLTSSGTNSQSLARGILGISPNVRFVFVVDDNISQEWMDIIKTHSDYFLSRPLSSAALSKEIDNI